MKGRGLEKTPIISKFNTNTSVIKGENKIQLSDYIDNGISNLQKKY